MKQGEKNGTKARAQVKEASLLYPQEVCGPSPSASPKSPNGMSVVMQEECKTVLQKPHKMGMSSSHKNVASSYFFLVDLVFLRQVLICQLCFFGSLFFDYVVNQTNPHAFLHHTHHHSSLTTTHNKGSLSWR
jgi:hypothetical protein